MVDPEKISESKVVDSKNKKRLILGVVVVSLFFIIILAKPSIIGFGVYDENSTALLENQLNVESIEDVSLRLEGTLQNLSLYQQLNEQFKTELEEKGAALTDALIAQASSEAAKSNSEKTIALLEERLEEKTSQLSANEALLDQSTQEGQAGIDKIAAELELLQEKFDLAVQNSARSICCKNRVDDPTINSYDLVNNKIICLKDGEKLLSC